MATFHLFSQLPAELRLQIWEMTVKPRIVNIQYCRYGRFLFSSTPIPGPLQTWQEARNAGLYQRAFSELPEPEKKKKKPKKKKQRDSCEEYTSFLQRFSLTLIPVKVHQDDESSPEDYERRYFWLNLDIDMVDIGETELSIFEPVAHTIKRLRFTRDNTCEFWYRTESNEIYTFSNATEVHVVLCKDGDMENWHGASVEHTWPCSSEKVVVVDLEEGQSMKLKDLEDTFDRRLEEQWRRDGYETEICCGQVVRYLDEE